MSRQDKNLAYIDDTKLYVTTEKLRYDTTNEGKIQTDRDTAARRI